MTVIAVVCFVVAVGLGVVVVRTRAQDADLELALRTTIDQRDRYETMLTMARDEAAAARKERDEAFDRVQRARREAAEVSARLAEEVAARSDAESTTAAVASRCGALERDLEEARAQIARGHAEIAERAEALERFEAEVAESEEARRRATPPDHGDVLDSLWDLALARVERTWRTSISLTADEPSPLIAASDTLRTAVEIEIDAAREEAGADIDLVWTGEGSTDPAAAVVVLAIIEAVVGALAKVARSTTVRVSISPQHVDVGIEALDDRGEALSVAIPDAFLVGPGLARVPVAETVQAAER